MSPPSRASLASSADIRKVCSLWIHNSSFSKQEVLFNAALLPRGSATNGLLLKILPHHPHASPSLQTHVPPLSRPSHAPSFADSSSDSTAFVFVAHDLSNDQRSKHPNLQVRSPFAHCLAKPCLTDPYRFRFPKLLPPAMASIRACRSFLWL